MSLARQIVIETAQRGDGAVLVANGLRIGGQALALMARNLALHLQGRGIGRGALVAVRSDDLVASLASILATGLLGCRWAVAGMPGLAADLVLDTAPEGQLLPGAVLLDESWSLPPTAGVAARFPGPVAADAPWLILPEGAGEVSERALEARLRAEAGFFDRREIGVAGLAGPERPEMLLLALATLFHGGVLVESADPEVWRAEGVSLVAGRPWALAACLRDGAEKGPGFRDLLLWHGPKDRAEGPFLQRFARVTRVLLADMPEAGVNGAEMDLVPLALLDQLFAAIDGVAGAATFLVPKPGQGARLTAFLVLENGADLPRLTSEARIAALRLGGKAAVPKRFLLADSLPRRDDGSLDRDACRAQVLAARLKRQRKTAEKPGGSESQS